MPLPSPRFADTFSVCQWAYRILRGPQRTTEIGVGMPRQPARKMECDAMRCTATGLGERGGGPCRPPFRAFNARAVIDPAQFQQFPEPETVREPRYIGSPHPGRVDECGPVWPASAQPAPLRNRRPSSPPDRFFDRSANATATPRAGFTKYITEGCRRWRRQVADEALQRTPSPTTGRSARHSEAMAKTARG